MSESVCMLCGNHEKGLVYIKVLHEGEEKLVCPRCLPVLIHGAH